MWRKVIFCSAFIAITACNYSTESQKDGVWTLYKSGVIDTSVAVHVATFDAFVRGDAVEDATQNQENCEFARSAFQAKFQLHKTNFWCERGRKEQS